MHIVAQARSRGALYFDAPLPNGSGMRIDCIRILILQLKSQEVEKVKIIALL